MQAPINHEHLQKKWAPLLDYEGLEPIKDNHKRMVTAQLLENQETALREEREFLSEQPTNSTGSTAGTNPTAGFGGLSAASGPTAGFDPVLISLIRRAMPNLVAYDLAGVQPMNGPTGLIFAMRSRYKTQGGTEALFNEADTSFAAQNNTGNAASSGYTQNQGANSDSRVGMGTTGQTTSVATN